MKRKIKIWNKIRLYETSAVGIPAYPDAHFNTSFSLIKAISNASLKGFVEETEEIGTIKLNTEEIETMEEKSQSEEIKKQETETVEEKSEESKETEEAEAEKEPAGDETEKKSDISEMIAKAIKDGIKDGIKEFEAERGLVEKQIPTEKSLGELAIKQGLFVTK